MLNRKVRATLPSRGFFNQAQVAEVGFEPEIGLASIDCHNVVNDFGNIVNPVMAELQVRCGAVRRSGQTLCEHTGFDENSRRLTATFMEYVMPRADIVLKTGIVTDPALSTCNHVGTEGCGAAGSMVAVVHAHRMRGEYRADLQFMPIRI